MLLNQFTLHKPKTLKEAVKMNSELKGACVLAGGTFLLNSLKVLKKKGLKSPENIISLKSVKDLKGISLSKDTLTIGSMTTLSEIIMSKDIAGPFSVIKTVSENIATTPIRNMATIGGNITCRYTWTEFPAVLIALKAQLHFIDKNGKEKIISSEDFFNNNAKTENILTHITIKAEKNTAASYFRVKKSTSVDIPMFAVCAKTVLNKNKFSSTRVCVNTGVTFPKRIVALEEFLDKNSIEDVLKYVNLDEIDKGRDEYKDHIYKIAIRNVIKSLHEKK